MIKFALHIVLGFSNIILTKCQIQSPKTDKSFSASSQLMIFWAIQRNVARFYSGSLSTRYDSMDVELVVPSFEPDSDFFDVFADVFSTYSRFSLQQPV